MSSKILKIPKYLVKEIWNKILLIEQSSSFNIAAKNQTAKPFWFKKFPSDINYDKAKFQFGISRVVTMCPIDSEAEASYRKEKSIQVQWKAVTKRKNQFCPRYLIAALIQGGNKSGRSISDAGIYCFWVRSAYKRNQLSCEHLIDRFYSNASKYLLKSCIVV